MTISFDNGMVQLYQADARSLPIPDNSVDCVVTSPPYWGLRDYGLDEWMGGDEGCDHKGPPHRTQSGFNERWYGKQFQEDKQGSLHEPYKDICGKCGSNRIDNGIGLEPTPEDFCANMVEVFREVWRVLKPTGTVWLNLGDSYVEKGLVGIPWRVAFALQADGWYLRSDIIWSKPNPMPESGTDRPTTAHEYVFLLTKSARYYYDADAIREPHSMTSWTAESDSNGFNSSNVREHARFSQKLYNPSGRNKRTVGEIATQPYPEAHFATYPEKLVEPCILAGCPQDGTVLDPFVGSGTTLAVAQKLVRKGIGTDLSAEYLGLAAKRLSSVTLPMILQV